MMHFQYINIVRRAYSHLAECQRDKCSDVINVKLKMIPNPHLSPISEWFKGMFWLSLWWSVVYIRQSACMVHAEGILGIHK